MKLRLSHSEALRSRCETIFAHLVHAQGLPTDRAALEAANYPLAELAVDVAACVAGNAARLPSGMGPAELLSFVGSVPDGRVASDAAAAGGLFRHRRAGAATDALSAAHSGSAATPPTRMRTQDVPLVPAVHAPLGCGGVSMVPTTVSPLSFAADERASEPTPMGPISAPAMGAPRSVAFDACASNAMFYGRPTDSTGSSAQSGLSGALSPSGAPLSPPPGGASPWVTVYQPAFGATPVDLPLSAGAWTHAPSYGAFVSPPAQSLGDVTSYHALSSEPRTGSTMQSSLGWPGL